MRPFYLTGFLLLLLLPGLAGADAFQDHYTQGGRLAESGKFDEAIQEMRAAYRIRPFPRVLANLGIVHLKAKRYPQALELCQRYLREEKDPPPEFKERINVCIKEARAAIRALNPPHPKPATAGGGSTTAGGGSPQPPEPVPEPSPPPLENQPPAPEPPPRPLAPGPVLVQGAGQGLEQRIGTERGQGTRTTPLYKRWWLWTGIGVIAAGAVVTGVVLGTQEGQADPLSGIPEGNRRVVEF